MILIIVISIYFFLLLWACIGFRSHPIISTNTKAEQKVSVIIVARNEEEKIRYCINTIVTQKFPKQSMEIIVVDDHSSDATFKEATEALARSGVEHRVICNQTHLGKKQSLKLAIEHSSSELIVCRDADTFTLKDHWLSSIVSFAASSKKEFIICPVAIAHKKGFLSSLQEIEMAILSLFTISSSYFKMPFLCNGANLVFTKKLFYETGAYQDHIHLESGDDIFFLEKVKKMAPDKIAYLKNVDTIVYTFPEKDINALLHQKIRWSSKLFKSKSVINWLSALIIASTNLIWIASPFLYVLGLQNLPLSLIFILSKLLIDILLVFLASSFIKVKTGVFQVAIMAFVYPFYASLIAVLSVFIKPKWKRN